MWSQQNVQFEKNLTELSRNKASGDFSFFLALYIFRHFFHTCTPVPLSLRFCSRPRAAENRTCIIRKGFFLGMLCFATPNAKSRCWDRCFCEDSWSFLRGPTAAGCAAPVEYLRTLQDFNKRYLNKVSLRIPTIPQRCDAFFVKNAAAYLWGFALCRRPP